MGMVGWCAWCDDGVMSMVGWCDGMVRWCDGVMMSWIDGVMDFWRWIFGREVGIGIRTMRKIADGDKRYKKQLGGWGGMMRRSSKLGMMIHHSIRSKPIFDAMAQIHINKMLFDGFLWIDRLCMEPA